MNKNETLVISTDILGLMGVAEQHPSQSATLQVSGGDLRFTTDGTDPAVNGSLAVDGSTVLLQNRNEITSFRGIRDGGSDVTLKITFEERTKHATNFTNTEA